MALETSVIILVLVLMCQSLVIRQNTSYREIQECIKEIFNQFVSEDTLIVPIDNQTTQDAIVDNSFISNITSLRNMSLMIFDLTLKRENPILSKYRQIYLLEFRDLPHLQNLIDVARIKELWNVTTKFIAISLSSQGANEDAFLSLVIENLHRKNIFNFIIVAASRKHPTELQIYSWFPFANGNCANNYKSIEKIGTYHLGKLIMYKEPFTNKVPNKFSSCVLKVGALIWPPYVEKQRYLEYHGQTLGGLQVNLLNLIAEKLNTTLKYFPDPKLYNWGKFYPNGTITGLLINIVNEDVDILIGGFAASISRLQHLDLSSSHTMETIVWVVPHAKFLPNWKIVIEAMDFTNFLSICGAYIVICTLIWTFQLPIRNEATAYTKIRNILLVMFSFSVNNTTKYLPRTTKIRILSMSYILYSLNSLTFYETQLTTAMTQPYFEKQISTLDDILDSNLQLGILVNIDAYILADKTYHMTRKIETRGWSSCRDFKACLSQVANERMVFVGLRFSVENTYGEFISKDGMPLLYFLKTHLGIFPIHIIMRRNFFLKDQVDELILRILAAGFMEHWMKGVNYRTHRNMSEQFVLEPRSMNVDHLKATFIILFVGLSLSTVALLTELATHHKLLRRIHDWTMNT